MAQNKLIGENDIMNAQTLPNVVWPAGRGQHRRAVSPRRDIQNLYYRWSKEFLEAGKKRLAGDTARAATSDKIKELRREASALKEVVVAGLTLENRLVRKSAIGAGEDDACDIPAPRSLQSSGNKL